MRWIVMLLLVAACASSEEVPERPDLEVTSYREVGGLRVQFQLREGQNSDAPVKLTVENGDIRDAIRSPNLKNYSVFWSGGMGVMECTYPYGQTSQYDWAENTPLADVFDYTFLAQGDVMVTSRIGRGAPMVPRLFLRVSVPKDQLPAALQWEGREAHHLTRQASLLLIDLPKSDKGVLVTGDWNVELRTKKGTFNFLIGVDPDGTPTASTGFVRRAQYAQQPESVR